ncbi:hypothetical protein COP2_044784 [Malus domestica]
MLHLQVLHKKRIMRQMGMEKRRKISLQSPSAPRRRKRRIKLQRRSKNHRINQTLSATNELSEVTEAEQMEEDTSNIDMKERLKKVVSVKKKSSKELDAAAKVAAQEAATRRARLAATKKKEKNHYNQQLVQ